MSYSNAQMKCYYQLYLGAEGIGYPPKYISKDNLEFWSRTIVAHKDAKILSNQMTVGYVVGNTFYLETRKARFNLRVAGEKVVVVKPERTKDYTICKVTYKGRTCPLWLTAEEGTYYAHSYEVVYESDDFHEADAAFYALQKELNYETYGDMMEALVGTNDPDEEDL